MSKSNIKALLDAAERNEQDWLQKEQELDLLRALCKLQHDYIQECNQTVSSTTALREIKWELDMAILNCKSAGVLPFTM